MIRSVRGRETDELAQRQQRPQCKQPDGSCGAGGPTQPEHAHHDPGAAHTFAVAPQALEPVLTAILIAQAQNDPKNASKPANIIEKMITGRLAKELKEVCLLEQAYVKDDDLTVGKYVEQVGKETGANLSIKRFVRFETGEGIEKKEEDFAAEVAAQLNN